MHWQTLLNSWLKPAIASALLLAATLSPLSLAAQTDEDPRNDPELKRLLKDAITEADSFNDRFDAEVWLTDMAARLGDQVENPEERVEILRHVHREALREGLEPELVLAVIDVESAFDRFAISSVGARGLMQIMPFWLDELDELDRNLFDVQTNLRFGCTILRYYIEMENGNTWKALARYNGSTGKSWYPRRVMNKKRKRWFTQ